MSKLSPEYTSEAMMDARPKRHLGKRAAGLWLAAWVGLACLGCARAGAGEGVGPWRVVVQDASVEPLDVSADGRLVVGREFHAQHVLHVVDIPSARTVLTVRLPARVGHAVLSPSGDTVAVSTGHWSAGGIYLVRVSEGRAELAIRDACGVLAFNKDATRLAVLGTFPRLKKAEPKYTFDRTCGLGVYDLAARKWLARTGTQAVIPVAAAFEGGKAVGYGTGGSPYHMLPRTFPCHTTLDPASGEAVTKTGPVKDFSYWKPQKPPKPVKAYQAPAFVEQRRQARKNARERLIDIRAKLYHSSREPAPFAAIGEAGRVRFIAKSWFTAPRGWHVAVLTVDEKGRISGTDPVPSVARWFRPCGNRLVTVEPPKTKTPFRLRGAATGEGVLELPRPRRKRYSYHPMPDGVLMVSEELVYFYGPRRGRRLWRARLKGPGQLRGFSSDGSLIAFFCRPKGKQWRVEVIETKKGKRVLSLPLAGDPSYYAMLRLDAEGRRLAVLAKRPRSSKRDVQVYGLADGKRSLNVEAGGFEHSPTSILAAGKGRWLVSSYNQARLLGADGRWGASFQTGLEGSADRAEPLPAWTGDRLLVENAKRQAILDAATGKVLDRQVIGGFSVLAFGGRVLVRSTRHLSDVEFVDLGKLEVTFTLHPVPVGKKFGWIATTPDGCWDASPGAEKYVAVFRGAKFAGEAGKAARRRKGLIAERLGKVLGAGGKGARR